jgi:hypothetical protein
MALAALLAVAACGERKKEERPAPPPASAAGEQSERPSPAVPPAATLPAPHAPPEPAVDWLARAKDQSRSFALRLSAAAMERLSHRVVYDPAYVRIPYPMGDVPSGQGVCTDEIVRAYRTLGIDLQRLVHEDMVRNFAAYPRRWGLARPDTNIDHRRVPNLQVFFARHGKSVPPATRGTAYQAGDLVTWMLPGNLPHIGIATEKRSPDGERPLIVHNIGRGPQLEDMLFRYRITGHYVFTDRDAKGLGAPR